MSVKLAYSLANTNILSSPKSKHGSPPKESGSLNAVLSLVSSVRSTPQVTIQALKQKKELKVEIPSHIKAIYTNDYNILRVHDIVVAKLTQEKQDGLHQMREQLIAAQIRTKLPQNVLVRRTTLDTIARLEEEIKIIESGKRLDDYLRASAGPISEYKRLGPAIRRISFEDNTVRDDDTQDVMDFRLRLIASYFNIAQHYISIEAIHETEFYNCCDRCGSSLEDINVDDNGFQTCPNCNTEHSHLTAYPLDQDGNNFTKGGDYLDEENFRKAFYRYQGKQPDKIPPQMFTDLDSHFDSRGRPNGEHFRQLECNDRGRKGDTDLPMLLEALQKKGYNDYYDDANLIAHKYWGWRLPDLSHIEDAVMSDYRKTQKVYLALPKDRISSLSTQFRLFKHLQMRGHECYSNEFKLVEIQESREFHEKTWESMCEGCRDEEEIYYIPTL